jgi:hypothetical protein
LPNEGETVGVFTDQPGSSSGSSSSTEWGAKYKARHTINWLKPKRKKKIEMKNNSRDDGRKMKENTNRYGIVFRVKITRRVVCRDNFFVIFFKAFFREDYERGGGYNESICFQFFGAQNLPINFIPKKK